MTDLAEPITRATRSVAPRRRPVAAVGAVAFLSALAWFAHFAGWRQMGFFADDHSFAVLTMAWTPADAAAAARTLAFSYPEPQGRPLGFLLGLELPYAGYRAAGVFGMFAVGWLVLSLNAGLLYALLARRLPRPLPLVGGLMFLLFPADTTRPFLCHAHILQPSLTFALVAAHLLLCRPWWLRALGYPIAGLCLVTYETALLPLLAAPLLDAFPYPLSGGFKAGTPVLRYSQEPDSPASDPRLRSTSDPALGVVKPSVNEARGLTVRRYAVHVAALGALVGIVAVTRAHGGEYRAVGATGGKGTVVAEIALGSLRGPLAVADACVRRPWQQLVAVAHRPGHAARVILAAALFAVVIGFATRGRRPSTSAVRRAALFGAAALAVSYLFCFTHYPPTCEEGQSTSVHTAAVIGTAALASAVVGWLLLLRSRRWAVAVAAVYFGLLFGRAVDEQAGFAAIWHERQSFWSQVLALCPDLPDRTVILCDGQLPQPTWLMPGNLWSDAMVLPQVYRFPATDRLPPMLASFPRRPGEDWRSAVARDQAGRLVWRTPPCNCPADQALAEADTILLRVDNAGRVTRVGGPVDVGGRPFRPRPPGSTWASFPTLPFHDALLGQ